MHEQNNMPTVLAREATARLVLNLPFDAVDCERGDFVCQACDFADNPRAEGSCWALDMLTVTLTGLDPEEIDKVLHDGSSRTDLMSEPTCDLCLDIERFGGSFNEEENAWFELASIRAKAITNRYADQIACLSAELALGKPVTREACALIVLAND